MLLVEEKRTGALFAMKVLKKEFVIENDELSRWASGPEIV